MNQLPLVDSSACCDIANALVAGKLNPQQALARTSIWSALSRFASRDMSETYPGLLDDRKQKKFACSLKVRRAAQRAAGLELHLVKLDVLFQRQRRQGADAAILVREEFGIYYIEQSVLQSGQPEAVLPVWQCL